MFSLFRRYDYSSSMTVDTFKRETDEAVRNYDRHVVCLHKTPDEFAMSLVPLLAGQIFEKDNGERPYLLLPNILLATFQQSNVRTHRPEACATRHKTDCGSAHST